MPESPNKPGARRSRKEYDHLLHRLAYPASREYWENAGHTLNELRPFVQQKIAQGNASYSAAFTGTAIPGNLINASFSFALTRWLVHQFPRDVHIESSGADPETIRIFFRALLPRTEFESISTGELLLAKRIRRLKGGSPLTDLAWLLRLLDDSPLQERVKELLFQSLQITTKWKISHPLQLTAPVQNKLFCFAPAPKKTIRLSAVGRQPLPPPIRLSLSGKKEFISIARSSLALLCRETEPFTYADKNAVTCFNLKKGLTVVLYGMEPGRKLSIESYIGYLAMINGIPVAYGGGWIFGRRCQFGINILPAFRGGESAWLFAQLLRVYRQYYGVSQWVIQPYQFGKKNPEAIRSGAFWFYYKLGFRPEDRDLQALARSEWQQKKSVMHYRCPPAILKKLAGSLLWYSNTNAGPLLPDAALASKAITAWIQSNFAGNRERAIRFSMLEIKKQFPIPSPGPLKKAFINVLQEWGLLTQAMLHPEAWKAKDRKAFVQLLLVKARGDERRFNQLLQKHPRFWQDLAMVPANPSYI